MRRQATMPNYQFRSVEAPAPYIQAPSSPSTTADIAPSQHSFPSQYNFHELASTGRSQYIDLESAENELAAWIRNANRGPEAVPVPSYGTPHQPTPVSTTWEVPLYTIAHPSVTMNSHSDSQYHYQQDPSQSYYPPPSSPRSPALQPYYHNSTYPPTEQAYGSHPYPSQYPSPSAALSPSSSSTDPELKRIRNTAASARFRAKKKRREASLERNAKEKREVLGRLEERIRELEAENQFLKGLIFDKEKLDGVKSELERVRELKRGLEMEGGEGERDDGVGTEV